MVESFLSILACPDCQSSLEWVESEEAKLICSSCKTEFFGSDGIFCLLPKNSRSSQKELEAKLSEIKARDEQAGDYDKMLGLKLFGIAEVPLTIRLFQKADVNAMVEVGCGTGRMTPKFANLARQIIAIDFSLESLKRCKDKLKGCGITNVLLVQGDATQLPIATSIADQVVSCQVLEHVPSKESRASMVNELGRIAKSGGSVVLSAYKHSLLMKIFGKKEGEHTGGIYYYRFSKSELRELVSKTLRVKSMTGILVYHYLISAVKA